jgi:hypothetical protein
MHIGKESALFIVSLVFEVLYAVVFARVEIQGV